MGSTTGILIFYTCIKISLDSLVMLVMPVVSSRKVYPRLGIKKHIMLDNEALAILAYWKYSLGVKTYSEAIKELHRLLTNLLNTCTKT